MLQTTETIARLIDRFEDAIAHLLANGSYEEANHLVIGLTSLMDAFGAFASMEARSPSEEKLDAIALQLEDVRKAIMPISADLLQQLKDSIRTSEDRGAALADVTQKYNLDEHELQELVNELHKSPVVPAPTPAPTETPVPAPSSVTPAPTPAPTETPVPVPAPSSVTPAPTPAPTETPAPTPSATPSPDKPPF